MQSLVEEHSQIMAVQVRSQVEEDSQMMAQRVRSRVGAHGQEVVLLRRSSWVVQGMVELTHGVGIPFPSSERVD